VKWNKYNNVTVGTILLILCTFTTLKMGHWDNALVGPHPQKYQRAVGPAMDMAQNIDPFRFVDTFKVDPVRSNPGSGKYPHIPFMEVGLAASILIFPFSLQLTTHLFANFLGCIILLLFFFYTQKAIDKRFAILSTGFMSTSYYLNLISFTTPQDTIMFVFFFASLLTAEFFWEDKNTSYLAMSGFLAGLGFNAKYTLIIILSPIIMILFYYRSKNKQSYFANLGIFYTFFIVPETLFRLFIKHIPSSHVYLIPTIVSLAVLIPIFKKPDNLHAKYGHIIKKILQDKVLIFVTTILGIISLVSTFFLLGFNKYIGGFITLDASILLNPNVYLYILNDMKPLLTKNVYYLGIAGWLITPYSSMSKYQRMVIYAFITGSLSYLTVALKPVYFHMYYKFIFAVCFSLLATVVIYQIIYLIEKQAHGYKFSQKKMLLSFVGLTVILLLTAGAVQPVINSNFETQDVKKASNYLEKNTDKGELFLRQNSAYLSLSADRQSISPGSMDYENLSHEIRKKGFGKAMTDNNVTYIVSAGAEFSPNEMSNPYSEQRNVRDIGGYRSALIKHEVGSADDPRYFNSSNNSYGERIKKYIEFETEIQNFYFYRIRETAKSTGSNN